MMMKQAKDKIFWPEMRANLREVYKTCQECKTNRPSKSQEHNEVSQTNLFDSYLPGQRILVDYAISGHQSYILNEHRLLDGEEMHRQKGSHQKVESEKRKGKTGEDRENEVGIKDAGIDS